MAQAGGRAVQGSRRSRQQARRDYRVEFTLTATEFAAVRDAADRAGLARGAYAAQAVLAAAHGDPGPQQQVPREALRELIRAAGLIRRIGVNLNQAVAMLNATGQRSADLDAYASESIRRARRVDAAADAVRKTVASPRPLSFRPAVRGPEHGPGGAGQSPSGPAAVRLVPRNVPRAAR